MTDFSSERLKWPDPVLAVKDAMDTHACGGAAGEYAVFYLTTGKPVTMDTYPSRGHARYFAEKRTRDHLLILEVQPDGMPYKEADACLKYERTLVSAGYRTPDTDPEDDGLVSMPRMPGDRQRMLHQYRTGRPLPGIRSNLPEDKPIPPAFMRKVS